MRNKKEQAIVDKLRLARDFQMNDLLASMHKAKSNFLTALGLVCYTEFWGYLRAASSPHGATTPTAAFNEFFRYLGPCYRALLKSEPDLYDLVRNGLAHEYLPKQRAFVIAGPSRRRSDKRIRELMPCGMVASPDQIVIFNQRYWLDFQAAVDQFIDKLANPLPKNLVGRCERINFKNFN